MNLALAEQLDELGELTRTGIALPSEHYQSVVCTTTQPFQHGDKSSYSGRGYTYDDRESRIYTSPEHEPINLNDFGGFQYEVDEESFGLTKGRPAFDPTTCASFCGRHPPVAPKSSFTIPTDTIEHSTELRPPDSARALCATASDPVRLLGMEARRYRRFRTSRTTPGRY